ncbi:MAG TPA: hypothetical protein VKF60_11235 [Myxococcota bacterium]|nr:hypothetical protein [Myxococcota bacterium]
MKAHTVLMLVLTMTVPLAGCATLERGEAIDTENLLAAAGFEAKPADTPARLANLRTLPARKLIWQLKDDKFVYSYADPDFCACLYVGGAKEYSAYRRLDLEQEIAEERMREEMDWEAWW